MKALGNGARAHKTLVEHQDPVESLLKIWDSAFRLVVPGPGLNLVGLRSISEKQVGAPGWYLWFEDRPGAYLLEFAEVGVFEPDSKPKERQYVKGHYRIKFYPDHDDIESLRCLSAYEQVVRESDYFDKTGTPDSEWVDELPEAFFQIAGLEVIADRNLGIFLIRLIAPERWITWGKDLRDSADKARDRDVPAWDWSWFLFDRLVQILCLGYRTAPKWVAFSPFLESRFSETSTKEEPGSYYQHIVAFCTKSGCAVEFDSLLHNIDAGVVTEASMQYVCGPQQGCRWVPSAWWELAQISMDMSKVSHCCHEDFKHAGPA